MKKRRTNCHSGQNWFDCSAPVYTNYTNCSACPRTQNAVWYQNRPVLYGQTRHLFHFSRPVGGSGPFMAGNWSPLRRLPQPVFPFFTKRKPGYYPFLQKSIWSLAEGPFPCYSVVSFSAPMCSGTGKPPSVIPAAPGRKTGSAPYLRRGPLRPAQRCAGESVKE